MASIKAALLTLRGISIISKFVIYLQPAHAAFYVCPALCLAKLLPRDMESIGDCLCLGHEHSQAILRTSVISPQSKSSNVAYQCPKNAKATTSHPLSFSYCQCNPGTIRNEYNNSCTTGSFQCSGRYILKSGVLDAQTVADCDCQLPYSKDDASGECQVLACPRAGNYMPKSLKSNHVQSLADCTCVEPFVKNDQSGECLAKQTYHCPKFSSPQKHSVPRSFRDCHCDYGFVRDGHKNRCKHESRTFTCPRMSYPRHDMPLGQHPRSFHDCHCIQETHVVRNEDKRRCEKIGEKANLQMKGLDHDNFTCPYFSRNLSPHPISIDQCECIAGYGWKSPEMICVRLSSYHCPLHSSVKESIKDVEESFDDCTCAQGYMPDLTSKSCVPWYMNGGTHCPEYSVLRRWPPRKANCECVFGIRLNNITDTVDNYDGIISCNPLVSKQGTLAKNFMNCPEHALANTWPVKHSEDCTCLPGFAFHNHSKAECRSDASFADTEAICTSPRILQQRTGRCRLPLEIVQSRSSDAVRTIVHDDIEYEYMLTEHSVMIIQGDIAIGELLEWDGIQVPLLHGYYNKDRDHRWRNATICFEISKDAAANEENVYAAMQQLKDVAGFAFHHCLDNNCHRTSACGYDYIDIIPASSSCYSYIGRIGGRQSLGVSHECGVGNLVHVLLHAVGLHHTTDRADRDDHVRIAWECLPRIGKNFFVVAEASNSRHHREKASNDIPYDFNSIMHPPSDAFVNATTDRGFPPWCQSIYPIIANRTEREQVMSTMGQREHASSSDVRAVWNLYPEIRHKLEAPTNDGMSTLYLSHASQVHPSRLHVQDDFVSHPQVPYHTDDLRRSGQFMGSFKVAAVELLALSIFGVGIFVIITVTAWKRRGFSGWKRMHCHDDVQTDHILGSRPNTVYYAESLLADKEMFSD